MNEALAWMRDIMTKPRLTVNEMKTGVCKLPEEKLDFWGYAFGRSPKTGRAYMGTVPCKKPPLPNDQHDDRRGKTLLDQRGVVAKLNRILIGANYL